MNDVSTIKVPGWQRLVGDLAAPVPDDRIFLLRLMSTLAQVSGAKQAVFFTLVPGGEQGAGDVRAAQVWPLAQDMIDAQGRLGVPPDALMDPTRVDQAGVERLKECQTAARNAGAMRQLSVYSLDDGQFYEGQAGRWFVIAAPVSSGLANETAMLPLRGVITLLVESRSRAALQSTLALIEVLCGYMYTHEAQQALRRSKQASASLDLAARLIAAMNSAPSFKACAFQLVNDLCRQLSADRVGLGWVRGSPATWSVQRNLPGVRPSRRELHLFALSDTEHVDRRMELCRKIESAMEECLDQEQAVMFPPPVTGADAVLSQSVVHAHRELARGDANLRVVSFPLRVTDSRGERVVGVLLMESSGATRLDVGAVELVQATLDLVAPVLAVRASDDRALPLRAWDTLLRGAAWAVGPRHTVWKVAGIACMIATAVLFLGRTTYRVGAPFEMQADVRRVVSVPVEGIVLHVPEGVRPGKDVRKGEVLCVLDTRALRLKAAELSAQRSQHEKQADEALRKGNASEAAQSRARADQASAQLDLVNLQIEQSTIVSPIDGTIIAGEVHDRLGSLVKMGDNLFEVADRSTMIVKARVEDRDISYIRVGQSGEISPKANPSLKVPFEVDQIVPMSVAQDGANVFEVRGRLLVEKPQAWFLPGLEGQAKFNTQKRSLAWILSRRVVDQLRVWLWW